MWEMGWPEWGVGLIGLWLVAGPCLLALNPSEGLWERGLAFNMGLATLAMAALAIRGLSTGSKKGGQEGSS